MCSGVHECMSNWLPPPAAAATAAAAAVGGMHVVSECVIVLVSALGMGRRQAVR